MADVKIRVRVDKDKAESDTKSLASSMTSSFTEINQALEIAGKMWRAVVDTVGEWVRAASEQEAVERRLSAALQIRGQLQAGAVQGLLDYNSAMESKYAVDEKDLARLQGTLLAMGVHREELEDATKATIGLAAATGQDLASAGTTVAKVYEGNISGLKRMGIEATSSAEALTKFRDWTALAAQQADGFAGNLYRLDDAWGDMTRGMGEVITKSEVINGAMAGMANAVSVLSERLQKTIIRDLKELDKAIALDMKTLGTWLGLNNNQPDFTGATSLDVSGDAAKEQAQDERQTKSDQAAEKIAGPKRAAARKRREAAAKAEQEYQISLAEKSAAFDEKMRKDTFDSDLAGLKNQKEIADATRKIEEAKTDIRQEEMERRAAIDAREIANNEKKFQRELAAYDRAHAADIAQAEARDEVVQRMGASLGAGIQATIGAGVDAAAGGENVVSAMGRVLGGMLKSMGTLLIEAGTMSVLLGALGASAAPIAAFFGISPLTIPAGLAAIGAGAVMVGIGAAMGGGGPSPSTAAPSVAGGGGSYAGGVSSVPSRGVSALNTGGGTGTNVYNINFGQGFMVGTERQFGRVVRDALANERGLVMAR